MPTPSLETVFYIDDDPDDHEFFIAGLEASHPTAKCFVAKDSKSALEIIETIPVPNIIFIDLHLPKVNGIELLKKLKDIDAFSKIPTYILSSTLFEPYAITIREVGGDGFLKKPASLQDFKPMFDSILR
jgi:CheY-like chemotaxis protein